MNSSFTLERAAWMCRLVGVCALVVLLAACARESPASERAANVNASQLFDRACAKCHGIDGSGGLPMAANGPRPIDLRSPDWQKARGDHEIVAAIRDGRGAMPPFAGVLSGDEIAALSAHVRQLARSSDR